MCGAALQTSIRNAVWLSTLGDNAGWFHESLAGICSISRVDVNMFGVQTVRAMVSVTIAFHFLPAILTGKIFNCSLKLFGHRDF